MARDVVAKDGEKGHTRMSKRQVFLEQGAIESVERLVNGIADIDVALYHIGEALKMSQPPVSGKIVISFSPKSRVKLSGVLHYDVEPRLAQMRKNREDGEWYLAWMTDTDTPLAQRLVRRPSGADYENAVQSRKLLKLAEEYFKRRAEVKSELTALRISAPKTERSASTDSNAAIERVKKIKASITMDWKNPAKAMAMIDKKIETRANRSGSGADSHL
jgi:hypothetical protein